jgi:hypothetical protein
VTEVGTAVVGSAASSATDRRAAGDCAGGCFGPRDEQADAVVMSGREGFRGRFRKREPKYCRLRETSQAQRIGQARTRTGRRSWRDWCIRGKEAWDRIEGRVTVVDRESECGGRRNQWERTSEQPSVGSPCWLIDVIVAPGVAAFQIVTVSEVITAAFAVPMVAARPRTADARSKRFTGTPCLQAFTSVCGVGKGGAADARLVRAESVPTTYCTVFKRYLAALLVSV